MSSNVLDVVGVEKSYGGPRVVDAVSFSVAKGEFVTLLGPSGSGKSTTMMMIAGFEEPGDGDILIAGKSVLGVAPQRRNLGIVFQSYALFPHLSVLDNVAFALRMRGISAGERRASAGGMLEKVGLADFAQRKPAQLSGGQQQRVALARALVFEPDLLLLDEPLGALDRRLRESMQDEIKQIQHRLDVAVLFVTHDQEEAMTMSDRIVVMDTGRVVQAGTPEEVYRRPSNAFVAGFLGETNLLRCDVVECNGTKAVVRFEDGRLGAASVRRRVNGKALVAIRPERISVCTGAADGHDNVLRGTVTARALSGVSVRFVLRAGGQDVKVRCLDGDLSGVEVGADVQLAWSAADASVLTD